MITRSPSVGLVTVAEMIDWTKEAVETDTLIAELPLPARVGILI